MRNDILYSPETTSFHETVGELLSKVETENGTYLVSAGYEHHCQVFVDHIERIAAGLGTDDYYTVADGWNNDRVYGVIFRYSDCRFSYLLFQD